MGQPGPHPAAVRDPVVLKVQNKQISITDDFVSVTIAVKSGELVTTVIRGSDGKVEISG